MSKDESAIGGVLSRFLGARVLRYPFVSLRGTQLGSGRHGRLPERPMGADCKSVAKASKVRILHLPPMVEELVRGALLCQRSRGKVSGHSVMATLPRI